MKPSPRKQANSFLRTPHLWDGTSCDPVADGSDVSRRPVSGPVTRHSLSYEARRFSSGLRSIPQPVSCASPRRRFEQRLVGTRECGRRRPYLKEASG